LTPELIAFLKPGVAGAISCADSNGTSQTARIWAVRAVPSHRALELYVVRESAEKFLDTLGRNGRAAANIVEVLTYRSRAFKGPCAVSPLPIDNKLLDESLQAMNVAFHAVGLPSNSVEQMLGHFSSREMVGLWLEVDAIFDQSPKPGAGGLL
jgi:hypothetical protein